ncbi:NTP transferase domain-containing protein [Desulfothermobacter acidiphilus]|uniref:NTP transferase domain-containing protein n=1 Tax=Desulfothermobacter acidiphilus TaxID=1938353 RepID=UPI003F8A0C88
MIPAIVLAGAPNEGRLRLADPAPFEALIPVGGKPLTAYVLDALLGSKAIDQVLVVAPDELAQTYPSSSRLTFIAPRDNLLANLAAALPLVQASERVLLVTGDLPLLTSSAVEAFLELCRDEAELYYPIIPRSLLESRYPGIKRTYVRLREGVFTGGNVGLSKPAALARCLPQAEQLVHYRKSPLRLARLLGVGLLLRFITGRLGLAEAERKGSELLGVRGRAVIAMIPEIGVDVDKPEDLELVRRVIGQSRPC